MEKNLKNLCGRIVWEKELSCHYTQDVGYGEGKNKKILM